MDGFGYGTYYLMWDFFHQQQYLEGVPSGAALGFVFVDNMNKPANFPLLYTDSRCQKHLSVVFLVTALCKKTSESPKKTKMPQSSDFLATHIHMVPLGRIPKWKDRIPTIYFQGRVVSFREFTFWGLTSLLVALSMGEGVYLFCKLH